MFYFNNIDFIHKYRETLSFNPVFSPFYIRDGQIASSMVVYYSTIFATRLYWSAVTL